MQIDSLSPVRDKSEAMGQHPSDFLENRLLEAISRLFGDPERAILAEIRSFFDWKDLPGGDLLFRQGAAGDGMYVLASGRLKVLRNRKSGQVDTYGEIATGETVGEMALITGEPRSADIIAMRDSVLAYISKNQFEQLTERYPRVLMQLSKTIIKRIQRRVSTKRVKKQVTNLCVLPVSGLADQTGFVQHLCDALQQHGPVLMLDSQNVNALLKDSAIANSKSGEGSTYRRLTSWLDEQGGTHRFVVYVPDAQDSEWTRRCLRQSDEVLLVGDGTQSPGVHALEKQYLNGKNKLTQAGRSLILLHSAETAHPAGTQEWLAPREPDLHHHVRYGNKADFARIARFLSGNAVGLVLSGGAAKGLAHIGIIRALEEAGMPVDLVGGTSIGAIMGAFAANGWTGNSMRTHCREIFRKNPTSDFSLMPRVALFKGKKLENLLKETFGDIRIEDMWLNFFCVSCNLTRTVPHVHQNGNLVEALRASISIPGVFPPAQINNDLHVDGGVFNNMPVDLMNQSGVGSIIAVDLQMYQQTAVEKDKKIERKRRLPNLLFVVMESSMLSGRYLAQEYKNAVDIYFNPPLRGFSLIDWNKFDQIEEIGYQHAKEVLEAKRVQGTV